MYFKTKLLLLHQVKYFSPVSITKVGYLIKISSMVKHIVLFKLKETLSQEEKLKVMNDFKAAIEALPAKIGFIRHIFVGLNANSAEKWDICLDSEFDTLADVNAYAVHPDHVAAAGLLKEVKADRACVDYEF